MGGTDRDSPSRDACLTVEGMDNRAEVREFLTLAARPGHPGPGRPPNRHQRRVPGLRRSEVAALAGVSVEYYARIERGAITGASPESSTPSPGPCSSTRPSAPTCSTSPTRQAPWPGRRVAATRRPGSRTSLQWALDAITARPGVRPQRAHGPPRHQRLGRAFYSDVDDMPGQPPNLARFKFLDPASRLLPRLGPVRRDERRDHAHRSRPRPARQGTARPRRRALHPQRDFRRRWGAHNVRHHGAGTKTFHHPVVGELTLAYEGLEMAAEPGLTLTIYAAEPASKSEEALRLLASWAATEYQGTVPGPPTRESTERRLR